MTVFYITMIILNLVSLIAGIVLKTKGWWVGLIGVLLFGTLYVTEFGI